MYLTFSWTILGHRSKFHTKFNVIALAEYSTICYNYFPVHFGTCTDSVYLALSTSSEGLGMRLIQWQLCVSAPCIYIFCVLCTHICKKIYISYNWLLHILCVYCSNSYIVSYWTVDVGIFRYHQAIFVQPDPNMHTAFPWNKDTLLIRTLTCVYIKKYF